MKKAGLVLAVAAVIVLLFVIVRNKTLHRAETFDWNPPVVGHNSSNPNSTSGTTRGGTSAMATAPDLASRAASPNLDSSQTNEPAALAPQTVLDSARLAVVNYRSTFGEDPVGTNPEITAELMGKNPKHINFVTPESGLRVNDKGEMIDGYGTPFFFHQISGREMEIRSAGPDRIMWTIDDLVTR